MKIRMPIVAVVVAMLAALFMAGCTASLSTGQPSLATQFVDTLAIDGAKYGLTNQLSPRLEQGYSQGKIPYALYATGKQEERAALDALNGLQVKVDTGQPVTQQELADAQKTFVLPLRTLLDQYLPINNLPPDQPAK